MSATSKFTFPFFRQQLCPDESRVSCSLDFNSSFCFPIALTDLYTAATNLSAIAAIGLKAVAYAMPRHLPPFNILVFTLFFSIRNLRLLISFHYFNVTSFLPIYFLYPLHLKIVSVHYLPARPILPWSVYSKSNYFLLLCISDGLHKPRFGFR